MFFMRLSATSIAFLSLIVTGNMVSARPVPFDVIDHFKGRGLDVREFYARDVLHGPVEAARDFSDSNPINIVARESNEGPLKERDILDDNDDIHLGRELLDDPHEDLLDRRRFFDLRHYMRIGTVQIDKLPT